MTLIAAFTFGNAGAQEELDIRGMRLIACGTDESVAARKAEFVPWLNVQVFRRLDTRGMREYRERRMNCCTSSFSTAFTRFELYGLKTSIDVTRLPASGTPPRFSNGNTAMRLNRVTSGAR